MTTAIKSNTNEADPWTDLNCDDAELQNLLDKPLEGVNDARLREGEQHMGFDNSLGDSWIYPSNLPCRAYQLSIVQAALYRNTLVVLPTGLGKTFIAAVVMYNIYRWYPRGKVIFMAPTRPLVNQQIAACQKIMPFPRKNTIELTGKTQRAKRAELWKSKRVFFATPQVVQSDILGGKGQIIDEELPFDDNTAADDTEFPFDSIKLIVIDEAHKAKGKYAYAEVAQAIAARTKYFRVLALSATPGRTMDDVAEVCRNLMISHIEVRWDTSIDVLPYVHKRHMETVVVSLGDRIKEIREKLLEIIDPYLRQLIESNVLSGSLANINRNFLVFEQKHFQERTVQNGRHPQHSAILTNFAICISMYHSLELLERHGTRVFLNYFEDDEDGKAKYVIQMERRLRELVDRLKHDVGPNPFDVSAGPMTNGQIAEMPRDLDFGHPKFEKARECLLKHFEINADSRAIVFCEYRESVLLIYRMLLQHVPLLRPRCFVGQGGTGALRALTQKQQIQIMNDFRSGKSNILIATSIGEEGIDVGEVDLIVCFDISTSNPTRFVQRIGRTGRQKNGNVVMLVTEGREQQILRDVLTNKDATNKKLLRSSVVQQALYKHAPRLVPTEFKPKCIQTFITPADDDKEDEAKEGKLKKISIKKIGKVKVPDKGTQDLRKFFNKKPQPQMDAEDVEYFEIDTKMTQAKPGMLTQRTMEKSFDKMKSLFKDLQSPAPTQANTNGTKRSQNSTTEVKPNDIIGPIELSDDSPDNKMVSTAITPTIRKKLIPSQGSIKDFFKDSNNSTINSLQSSPKPNDRVEDRLKKLKLFLEKTITTPDVVKRAKITDLAYHLQSKEMSNDMKYVLLCGRPQFLRDNIEQINVINAVQDLDTSQETTEEKSIKGIHKTIVEIFKGLANVEKFLQDNELVKYKHECLANEISSDEDSESEDDRKFKNTLDVIFKDLGEPLKSADTYDWVQQKFLASERYKAYERSNTRTKIQESMVYNTFVEAEEDDDLSINNCDENSLVDSKYCSQWQEFNQPDLAFKSTPLHGPMNKTSNLKSGVITKRSSLLTKLEEAKENDGDDEVEVISSPTPPMREHKQTLNNSNKFLESLKMCEKSLNTLLQQRKKEEGDAKQSMSCNTIEDFESTSTDSDQTTGSLQVFETEHDFISAKENESKKTNERRANNVDKIDLSKIAEAAEDEDELFQAALAAELKFTQTKMKEEQDKSTSNNSLKDNNDTSDDLNVSSDKVLPVDNLNSSVNKTPSSLNSTPDIVDFQHKQPKLTISSTLVKAPEISIHHELDLDMEAFMEPFPEEQELMKLCTNPLKPLDSRRESFKENFAKDLFTRESPDLFAEEHMKSPNLVHVKPLPYKSTLTSRLPTTLSLQRCQSAINPVTSTSSDTFKSPQKLLRPNKSSVHLTSPTSRLTTDKLKNDKSPSVFDMYLKNAKGKVKLPKALTNTSSCLGLSSMTDASSSKESPLVACSQNESPLVVKKRGSSAAKRKIFDSDTEESEESRNDLTVIEVKQNVNDDSDFEEVAATQVTDDNSIYHRRKRRRFNSFIEHEAALSGCDGSEDETEHSVGGYLLDSVVVLSDENDEDQASTSHMQAMYLQSLKSPQNRRGAFKIPAPRVFNDHSRIFSQALLAAETCSQYMPDSFIVDEEDNSFINDNANVTDASMCPLEKAEKILRERRRAKKRERNAQAVDNIPAARAKLKRKRHILVDYSSDDDFD